MSYNKVEKEWLCDLCGSPCNKRNRFCKPCLKPDMTKLESKYLNSDANKHGLIRARARLAVKARAKKCTKCSYDKHVEVCHVKAIKDFGDDEMVSVINADSNLILLCPNCHWEHDHGNKLASVPERSSKP